MPAVAISGTQGAFALTGHNARIRNWSATLSHELNDATGFAQQPWREQIGGLKSLDGYASGYVEKDAASTNPGFTNLAAAGVSGTLTTSSGCTISGIFHVSAISIGTSVDGNATCGFSFRLSGSPTVAHDET